jgi:hypothetical protein
MRETDLLKLKLKNQNKRKALYLYTLPLRRLDFPIIFTYMLVDIRNINCSSNTILPLSFESSRIRPSPPLVIVVSSLGITNLMLQQYNEEI